MGFKEIFRPSEQKESKNPVQETILEVANLRSQIELNPSLISQIDVATLTRNLEVKNGKIALFGKEIAYWITRFELPEAFLEQLSMESIEITQKLFHKNKVLGEVLSVWSQRAAQISAEIIGKFRNDDDIINAQIGNVYTLFQGLKQDLFTLTEDEHTKRVNEIFSCIQVAEDQEDIIGATDMGSIQEILLGDESTSQKSWMTIMNHMRYGGWSGNSEGVKELFERELLQAPDFKSIGGILEKTPRVISALDSGNKEALIHILGKDIADVISDKYAKIKKGVIKGIEHYGKFSSPQEKEIAIKNGLEGAIKLQIRSALLYKKIAEMENRGDEDSTLTGIYADMVGLGENKGVFSDSFDITDENIDWIVEAGVTIGVGVVTLGVGTAAMVGGRILVGSIQAGLRLRNASLATRFVGGAVLDGITFYEGATIAQNLMYRELEDVLQETGNVKEIGKSILFMGALSGVMKGAGAVKGLGNNISSKVGGVISPKITEKILAGSGLVLTTGVIFTIGGIIEEKFGEGWDPTWEEYFHLMALLVAFHRVQEVGVKGKEKIPIWKEGIQQRKEQLKFGH